MLLELSPDILSSLLSDSIKLEEAIYRAKTEYIKTIHPSILPKKEDLAEDLYNAVEKVTKENAAKVTGRDSWNEYMA